MPIPIATCIIVNKGERGIRATLDALAREIDSIAGSVEIIVVDASEGSLDDIYSRYDYIQVVRFSVPKEVRVSIPHQRNFGIVRAAADVIVFTDAGCVPQPGWLDALLRTLAEGENLVTGRTLAPKSAINNYDRLTRADYDRYVSECPTINLALRRSVAESIGGFDESFAYGSDVDFSWRVTAAGYRIRFAEEAVVLTDWGSWRRQLKRSYVYGKARARLYQKHAERRSDILRSDVVVIAYPLYILALPLALKWPWYLALLAVPAWRNRRVGGPSAVLDHLVYGLGVLVEVGSWFSERVSRGPVRRTRVASHLRR